MFSVIIFIIFGTITGKREYYSQKLPGYRNQCLDFGCTIIKHLLVPGMHNSIGPNCTNSSKPPSSDLNRKKRPNSKTGKKPGGQKGHVGTTLKKVDDPDKVEIIKVVANCPGLKGYCAMITGSLTIKWIVRTLCATPII